MKKAALLLLLPLFLSATDLSKKVGFEFLASRVSEIGVKIHVNSVYTINPGITFLIGETSHNYYSNSDAMLGVSIDQQFYLPDNDAMNHYIYLNIGMSDVLYPDIPHFGLGYGLQYQCNDNIAIFGELGATVSPDYGYFGLGKSGLGLIFYVR